MNFLTKIEDFRISFPCLMMLSVSLWGVPVLLSLRHYWALGYPMDQVPNAFSLLQSPFLIFFLILLFFRPFQVTSANYLNLLLPVPCSAFCVEFSLYSLFWMRSDDFFYPGLGLPWLITPKHIFLFEEIWIYLYVPHIFLYIPIQLHRWMHAYEHAQVRAHTHSRLSCLVFFVIYF